MSAEVTGIPLVVRYNNQGQPDGLKEELNINVNSVSANEYKGAALIATSIPNVSSIQNIQLSTLEPNQILVWNDVISKWVNEDPPTGSVGPIYFTALADTPGVYTPDRFVVIDETTNTLEYSTITRTQLETFRNNINTVTNGQVILRGSNPDTFTGTLFEFKSLNDTQTLSIPNSGSKYISINDQGELVDATYSDTNVGQLITDLDQLELDVDAIEFVSALSAITISNIEVGEILVYEDATNGWVNKAQSTEAQTVKVLVRNETAAQINKGTVVYVNGVHGTSAKKLTVATAATTTPNLSDKLLGVLDQTLAIQGEGSMTIIGHAEPFNTAITNIAIGSEGSPVFLDPANPGLLTTTVPAKPNLALEVGILERRDSTNGEIFVRFLRTGVLNTLYNVDIPTPTTDNTIIYSSNKYIQIPFKLFDLKDTTITSPGTGDILEYTTEGFWVNKQPTVGGIGVDIPTTPGNGDVVSYNSSTSSFEAATIYHADLPDLTSGDHHPQYVLSATNQALSSLVTSIESSAVDLSSYIAANEATWSTDTNTTDHGSLTGRTDDDHTQYVIKSNSTQARNLIQPTADVPALTLQASLSNTGRLFDIKDSTTATVAYITIDGTIVTDGGLTVGGTKSFLIDHPTKEEMKLQYSCLEGPENGVYVRGRVTSEVIALPDYWVGLVHEDSITVTLTPVGSAQSDLYVSNITDNKVHLTRESNQPIDCFYTVNATRKDLENLVVEFPK